MVESLLMKPLAPETDHLHLQFTAHHTLEQLKQQRRHRQLSLLTFVVNADAHVRATPTSRASDILQYLPDHLWNRAGALQSRRG